jgi:hypothetical protein
MIEPNEPNADWPLDKLTAYIRDQIAISERRDRQARRFGIVSALHSYRVGQALTLVKDRLKEQHQYESWLRENGIGKTRAWQDHQLYVRAGCVDAIKDMTRTEARKHWNILRQPKPAQETNHDAQDLLPLSEYRLEACTVSDLGPRLSLAPASLDLAFADPPMAKAKAPLLADIGQFAKTYLRPGRLLLCRVGILNLPDIIRRLEAEGLRYFWCFGVIFPDMLRQTKLNAFKVRNGWRMVLAFSNGPPDSRYWIDDSQDGQGDEAAEALYWINGLTLPDETVAGLYGEFPEAVACRQLGRRFVGCDPVAWKVEAGRERLAAVAGVFDGYIYTRSRG